MAHATNANPPKRCGKQTEAPVQEATGDNDFAVPEPDPVEQDMLGELADLAGTSDQTDDTRATEVNEKVSTFHTQAVEDA